MSDTTYNKFQHYGTNAERLAFTPSPPASTQPIYIWYETDTGNVYLYHTSWILIGTSGGTTAHHTTHESGGTDVVTLAQSQITNLTTDLAAKASTTHATTHSLAGSDAVDVTDLAGYPGGTTNFLREDGTFAAPPTGGVPSAHHTTHESGGSDEIKLDDLKAPDDNTDLNSSTSTHGLLRKLSGTATEYLDGSGAWSTPAGGGIGSVQVATVSFTHSQILTMNSVIPTIIAAPGAGFINMVISVMNRQNFSAGVYGTANLTTLKYSGGGTALVPAWSNWYNQAGPRTNQLGVADAGFSTSEGENKAIVIQSDANPTGGNAANTWKISVVYVTLAVA